MIFSQGEMIAGAYAAAVDHTRWQAWGERLYDALGSGGGILGVIDRATHTVQHVLPLRDMVDGLDEYAGGMAQFDPQIGYVARQQQSTIITDSDHSDRTDPDIADFMRWADDRMSFFANTTLVAASPTGKNVSISIHFPQARAEQAGRVCRQMAAALAPLSAAMQIAFDHHDAPTAAYWDGVKADRDHEALLLLNEHGRAMRMNARAETMLERQDGLMLQGGAPGCALPSEAAALRACILRAIRPGEDGIGAAGGVFVSSSRQRAHYRVKVFPLPRSTRFMVAEEASALMTITELGLTADAFSPGMRGELGLSRAESRLLPLLMQGRTDETIAGALTISVSTVRSHVKSVLAKTGTRSKAELAHFLTRMADRP